MGIAVLLIVGIFAALIIASNLSNYVGGGPGLMGELGERFPRQSESLQAVPDGAMLVIQRLPEGEDDPRRPRVLKPRLVRVKVMLDEKHLHLRLDAGILGPDRRASIPWDVMSLRTTQVVKHSGESATIEAGGFLLSLPSHQILPYLITEKGAVVDVEYREVSDAPEDPEGPGLR